MKKKMTDQISQALFDIAGKYGKSISECRECFNRLSKKSHSQGVAQYREQWSVVWRVERYFKNQSQKGDLC